MKASQAPNRVARKPYRCPTLVDHGSVLKRTQGSDHWLLDGIYGWLAKQKE